MDELVVPGATGAPSLHLHVNPVYALYHYLAKEALRPPEERDPATAEASTLMEPALAYRRRNGGWLIWDDEVAWSGSPEEVVRRLRRALADDEHPPGELAEMERAIGGIGAAMGEAEGLFGAVLWPERVAAANGALQTLRSTIGPQWRDMALRQGELLGVTWPERIDAFLVTDCYDWRGGYSHPVTLDVPHHDSMAIREALLHEATHVADVYTGHLGEECLGDRLMARVEASGASRQDAWNVWHAVIFAASGRQVREAIDPRYPDYASSRGLYSYFRVPGIASLWDALASGAVEEDAFVAAATQSLVDSIAHEPTFAG